MPRLYCLQRFFYISKTCWIFKDHKRDHGRHRKGHLHEYDRRRGSWRVLAGSGFRSRLNLVAGARYLWLEADVDVDVGPVSGDGSDSDQVWDGIVGLRGMTDLNETWYLTYYADVGAGDSDLTRQALAAISYRFESVDAVFGYRYLEWDFDKGDMLNFDELDLSGPFAGVKFRF